MKQFASLGTGLIAIISSAVTLQHMYFSPSVQDAYDEHLYVAKWLHMDSAFAMYLHGLHNKNANRMDLALWIQARPERQTSDTGQAECSPNGHDGRMLPYRTSKPTSSAAAITNAAHKLMARRLVRRKGAAVRMASELLPRGWPFESSHRFDTWALICTQ